MNKKVIIIGGGIAGLASSICLRKVGIDSLIFEKVPEYSQEGLGFILLENGLEALDQIGVGPSIHAKGTLIKKFVSQTPQGVQLTEQSLSQALGIKRTDFISLLKSQIPEETIKINMKFSHFTYDSHGIATHACFESGEKIEGDIFIATDGVRSKIRSELFPNHSLSTVRVKELVCLVHAPDIAQKIGNTFLKTQDSEGGLAVGIVPSSTGDLIWYMQYDSHRLDFPENHVPTPLLKKEFAKSVLGKWPEPIPSLIDITDFKSAHIWFTTDMNLLPHFHKKNVVLLGDAAHAFLTFTSQGVNSALQDALYLSKLLEDSHSSSISEIESIFSTFSSTRRKAVAHYIDSGRDLANRFLYPARYPYEHTIPLSK